MNLTALFDVSTQRSAAPLDRAVGDGSSDPAFANVMSRYQGTGSDSLAPGTADAGAEPGPTGNGEPPYGAAVPTELASTVVVVDPTSSPTVASDGGSGEMLPVLTTLDDQSLPPTAGTAGGREADSTTSVGIDHGKPDDDLDDLNEIDAGGALLFAVPLPIPPTASTTLGGTAASAPMPAVVEASAPRHAAIAAASTAALATGADVGAASSVSEEVPQSATPSLTDREPQDDIDAVTKAAYSVAVSKTAPATGTETSNAADLRTGSIAGVVRASGQAPTSDGGSRSTNSGTGHQGDPHGQPEGALGGKGAPRIMTARFAAAVSSASQNDPTDSPPDTTVDSIRTDAVAQRANTSDAPRDLAPTRLGELAQQHAPRLASELADRVLVLRSQRFDSATVVLEPRDLGRIDIQVRLQADATHITFTAQHATVRDALEGQLPRLRALLEEAGLSLGMVDVSHSGSRNGGEAGSSRSPEQTKPAAVGNSDAGDSAMRWRRRVEASIIDLHA